MTPTTDETLHGLRTTARAVRLEAVKMVGRAGTGHIGGSLSCIDLLVALYFHTLKIDPERPDWDARDRFVLCKGHATPAMYAVLAERGFFPKEWLPTFDEPLSRLPKHVDMHTTPGIEMSTGALGQGLSVATGMALALRIKGNPCRVYALLSDGELQSGQTWEAAMAATKYKAGNLVAIVDRNGLQVDGASDADERIMPVEPLADKWAAFGWTVIRIDGHEFEAILDAYRSAAEADAGPTVIIADTVKGKGVSFMEGRAAWHHKAITDEELRTALEEIERVDA